MKILKKIIITTLKNKEDNINKKDQRYKCLSYLNEINKNPKKM